uniref:Mitochondrial import inner membrane translocase subunit n=1 Tax=Blastobotrys adeninivorans TaxID=409370 RepID=A0A060TDZ5_BLAAD
MSGFTSIFGSSGSKPEAAMSTSSSSASNTELKKQIQEQISQELAVANATELVNKITENCFQSCFGVPGDSITAAEQTCTTQCMQKYMMAWNLISRSYIARIQQAGTQQ